MKTNIKTTIKASILVLALISASVHAQSDVRNEYIRATYAEAGLQAGINQEAKHTEAAREVLRQSIVSTNATVLVDKIRALGAEDDLNKANISETKRATAAEASVSQSVKNETNRAVAAEAQLQASKANISDISSAVGKVYAQSVAYTDNAVATRNIENNEIKAQMEYLATNTSKKLATMDKVIDNVQSSVKSAQEGAAIALAVAGLPQAVTSGSVVSISVSNVSGKSAVAVGGGYMSKSGKWNYKGGVSISGGTVGSVVGASYSFN